MADRDEDEEGAAATSAAGPGADNEVPRQPRLQQLRALGFCGADDSVDPRMLGLVAGAYPAVEFGVLLRPDLEGTPRYASPGWVERLGRVASRLPRMKLAAHLCGSHADRVLAGGGDELLSRLGRLGFRRVQVNATARNGADTALLGSADSARAVLRLARDHPDLEIILQKNDETEPLWRGVLREASASSSPSSTTTSGLPPNVSMLVDESKGTGLAASSWPGPPPEGYEVGYAGGIGPGNIRRVLQEVREAAQGRRFWVDMETGLRSTKDGRDVFDLDKCYEVISAACESGLVEHPDYLACD